MTVKNKLLLSYFVSLVFLIAMVGAFVLSRFGLGLLFYLLLISARWGVNPVRTAYKKVWRSQVGKVCGLVFGIGVLGLASIILIQNYSATKLPVWLMRFWCYGFMVPTCIALLGVTIREEIRAANAADNENESCEAIG